MYAIHSGSVYRYISPVHIFKYPYRDEDFISRSIMGHDIAQAYPAIIMKKKY